MSGAPYKSKSNALSALFGIEKGACRRLRPGRDTGRRQSRVHEQRRFFVSLRRPIPKGSQAIPDHSARQYLVSAARISILWQRKTAMSSRAAMQPKYSHVPKFHFNRK